MNPENLNILSINLNFKIILILMVVSRTIWVVKRLTALELSVEDLRLRISTREKHLGRSSTVENRANRHFLDVTNND